MDHCDVLIVGAGPVGTTLALELALQGVSFRIIDKSPVRSEKSRALIVHPRTLELLDRHGTVDKLISRGTITRGGVLNINRKLVAKMNLDDLDITDTNYPLPLMVSQAETEQFLDESLADYGKAVERAYTATSVVQDANGVTTTLEKPDGTQTTVRSKYVVGCDGAHSLVRHSAKNLTFDGDAYPQDFILCDARLRNSNVARDRFTICFGDTGLLAFFPIQSSHSESEGEEDLIRLIASGGRSVLKHSPRSGSGSPVVPTEQQQRQHGEQTHEPPTLAHFQSLVDSIAPPGSGTVHSPVWLARFRLHHRGVNSYRSDRLFVAGDAAHIHSPAGGQGMNVGIQDAINLGWKLGTVLKYRDTLTEEAREALLDSYHAERYPVGRALLQGTDRIFSFTAAATSWVLKVRNTVLPWVMPWLVGMKWIRKRFYGFISGFGTTYSGLASAGESCVVGGGDGVNTSWPSWLWSSSSSSLSSRPEKVSSGDRLPDGKVIELGRSHGGITASDLLARRKETSLHQLCRGASWHLLLFSGIGGTEGRDAVTVEGLTLAGERVLAVVKKEDRGSRAGQGQASTYADPGGRVHGVLGLDNGSAGYVMVRPDGYVSHIGYLSSLREFIKEWETRVCI
ncbi:FAD binding domain-containing protein [Neurospora hispaniola]|uniref:FAD binding domain-containing protein n=1 Tax=Neurospora hispaniola TaxID=588809 RepID=A0AAJ0IET6_9PEZI|nr:FAD binding domain-containing protein [Neurospora hispaniola]